MKLIEYLSFEFFAYKSILSGFKLKLKVLGVTSEEEDSEEDEETAVNSGLNVRNFYQNKETLMLKVQKSSQNIINSASIYDDKRKQTQEKESFLFGIRS